MGKTKEISVFVDESGSYDPDETSSLYYMVCLVFHDQDSDISGEILKLEEAIAATGRESSHCIHTAPLIRRENEYEQDLYLTSFDQVARRVVAEGLWGCLDFGIRVPSITWPNGEVVCGGGIMVKWAYENHF